MEKECAQRSWPAKAGAGELGAPRQKASPVRNVAKHLATRPSHRSPTHGITRSAQAPRRSDRSELPRPVRGPPGVRLRCCTPCGSAAPRRSERTRAPGKRNIGFVLPTRFGSLHDHTCYAYRAQILSKSNINRTNINYYL